MLDSVVVIVEEAEVSFVDSTQIYSSLDFSMNVQVGLKLFTLQSVSSECLVA